MKILNAIFSVGLAISSAVAFADPPSQVGRLNLISGGVSFAPAEASNDWGAATLNRPITTGDRFWTERDGRAELHVGSTAIRMSGLTGLDVLKLDDQTLRLRLVQGGLNVRVRRLAGDQTFEIDTPGGAVILGRPGSFRIDVDPSYSTTAVIVHYGEAEVLGSASSFRILERQQALVPGAGGAEYDIVAAPAADDFDDWAASRDRQEDQVAATRYVSDQMTGYEDLDEYGSWRIVGNYGSVWVPAVAAGWAPYRNGHWVWISPWGWNWVDDEPWGFAPFHYGRWVWLGRYWAWAPGNPVARPVYAPALVAFIGGSNWSVSVGIGTAPAVGWVPLGWHEPYIPWYRVSPTYVRRVNVAYMRDPDVRKIHDLSINRGAVTHIRYANRRVPSATTVVSRETFVSARQVSRATLRVTPRIATSAPVFGGAPIATPRKSSLMPSRLGYRPPAELERRPAFGSSPARKRAGAQPPERQSGRASAVPRTEERSRVRAIPPQGRTVPQTSVPRPPLPQGQERDLGRSGENGRLRPRAIEPRARRLAPIPNGPEPSIRERNSQPRAQPSGVPSALRATQPPRIQQDVRRGRPRESAPFIAQVQTQPQRTGPSQDRGERRAGPRNISRSSVQMLRPPGPQPRAPAPAVAQRRPAFSPPRVEQHGNRPLPRAVRQENARQHFAGKNQRKRERE